MDSYMNELFKKYRISDRYKEVCRFPESINKTTENISKAYEIQLITKYAEQIIFHAIGRAEKFAISNPNYPYPKEYENNYLEFWLTKSSNYQEANDVIKLLEQYQQAESPLKVDPPNKIVFNFTDEQIESLYNELIKTIDKNSPTGLIKNDRESFYQFMRNEMPKNKIKWLSQSSKNNNPNKKALVELFLIGHETNNPINNKPFIHIPNKNDADIEQAASQRIIRKFLNELIKETFLFRDTTNPDKWVSSEIKADKYPSPKTINKGTSIPYSDYYKIVYPDIFDKLKPPNTK